jgi:hypothetical protein
MSDESIAETMQRSEEGTPPVDGPEQPEETKPAKAKKQPHACLCQSYEVANPKDDDEVFSTGCEQDTLSTFAQGHDARLVSFLVEGHFDGYQIRQLVNGETRTFGTPAEAVADVSNALQTKAEKATANRQARRDEKERKAAEREAAKQAKADEKAKAKAEKEAEKGASKAGGPKATGAEVAAGSVVGDAADLAPGQARIKVGRWEYTATIDAEGTATFTNGKGETETRERDGYQLLQSA